MPSRRSVSPTVAALLSGLVPGLGHWYAGHRRRAAPLLGFTAVVAIPVTVVAVALLFGQGGASLLDMVRPFFEHPGYLLLLLAVNAAVLVVRLLAALDCYRLTGGEFSRTSIVALVALVAVLATTVAAPHAWAAQRNLALYDLLTHDYSVDPAQLAIGTTLPIATTSTSSTASPTTTVATVFESLSTVAPTTTTTTTTTTLAPLAERRINILLLGADAGPDRVGLRTDSIIVVSVDPATGNAALLQLPRNHIDLPFPEGHLGYNEAECHCYPEIANTLYQYGLDHPELFPGGNNSGATAVMDLVGYLYGIEIHNYALVDLLGFVSIIDALGGLTITVTTSVTDARYTRANLEEVPVLFGPGTYEMDGEEVLSYARVRRDSNDYGRMSRQRCVLQALAAQTDPVTLIRALPSLVPAIEDSILTDIPVADWPDFIALAAAVDTESIVSVRFMRDAPELVGTGVAYVTRNPVGYWVPIVEIIRDTVARVLSGQPPTVSAELGIPPLGEICGVS